MYNTDYKVLFRYKTLNYKDIEKIKEIIDKSNSLKVIKVYSSREIKKNRIIHNDKNEFENLDYFLEYLNNDIDYLDTLVIKMNDKNHNEITLSFNTVFNRWEITCDKKTMEFDGLILNLNAIFKFKLIDFYKRNKMILFFTVWFIYVIISLFFKKDGPIVYSLGLSVIALPIINIFMKCKPYKNNKFIVLNKDNIILGFLFYIAGVITPYIINLIVMIFNK